MAKRIVRSSMSREEAKKLVRQIPGILSGRLPSKFGLHKLFWGAIAYSMFSNISKAFEVKSTGAIDELGDSWKPLTQHYLAYQRQVRGGEAPTKLIRRAKESNVLGLLTPGQYQKWKSIFGTVYHTHKDQIGDTEAKAFAGQVAWTRLKRMGAQTKWEEFGTRNVAINRDSERLYLSLLPGEYSKDSGYKKRTKYQVFVLTRGKITIGTSVAYANYVDRTRPLWPEDVGPWIDEAVTFARDAIADRIERLIRS